MSTALGWTVLSIASLWPAFVGGWSTGFFGLLRERTCRISVPNQKFPAGPWSGIAYEVNLSALGLAQRADTAPLGHRSSTQVLQDSKPLRGDAAHADIATVPGLFSHWGNWLIYSPWKGPPHTDADRRIEVTIRYRPWIEGYFDEREERFVTNAVTSALSDDKLIFLMGFALAAGASLLAGLVGIAPSRSRLYAAVVVVSLGIGLAGWLSPRWDRWQTTPDTGSYLRRDICSTRAPGYPAFIAMTAGRGVSADTDPDLAKVVKAQKLVLVLALLALAAALLRVFPPPMVSVFCLWLAWWGFFTEQIDFVMSETLAQAAVLLFVALVVLFEVTNRSLYGAAANVVAAVTFTVRPAAAFLLPLALGMLLSPLFVRGRRFTVAIWTSVGVAACIASLPALNFYRCTGHIAPSPTYSWERVARALRVAERNDVDLLPDPLSRELFLSAFEKRERWYALHGRPGAVGWLNWNFYQGIGRTFSELAARQAISGESKYCALAHEYFMKVSEPVLAAHPDRVRALFFDELAYVVDEVSRLRWPPAVGLASKRLGALALVCAALVTASIVRGWVGRVSAALVLCHVANVMLTCLQQEPLPRYIHLTEFLFLIALFMLGLAAVSRIGRRLRPFVRPRSLLPLIARGNSSPKPAATAD